MPTSRRPLARLALYAALLAALAPLAGPRPAAADDRDLLRSSTGLPYVFIILDTSGSMNWAPPCSATDFSAGKCSFLCPNGDCYVPLQGDDSRSKLYQAKEALVTVLQGVNNVRFGFATYNQDGLFVRNKHWVYTAANAGTIIPGFGAWPPLGAQEVFGAQWTCNGGSATGCAAGSPADLSQAWQVARMQRLAKGDANFATAQTVWLKSGGTTYKVTYTPSSGSLGGATIKTSVAILRCTNGSCSSTTSVGTTTITWNLLSDFVSWDLAPLDNDNLTTAQLGFFNQGSAATPGDAADTFASNTCNGWDPNSDSPPLGTADNYTGVGGPYSIRYTTDNSDPRGSLFYTGDVIPLDWQNDHNLDLQRRMAPNLITNPTATPDYRIATYFNDQRQGADTFLRLKNTSVRPFMASGSTPIGASLLSFRQWYAGCTSGNCTAAQAATGWKSYAASHDPNFACSRKYVLFITDGDETCSGDPCAAAKDLHDRDGVTTYILGFGLTTGSGNTLTCVAQNGGSGTPIFPQNKQQLIDALNSLFAQIKEEATAFASAAVPQVQADITDKLFLTSFNPLNSESIWNGHVNAFLKPLPLTPDGKPDTTTRICDGVSITSSCLLWDAAAVVVRAAPPPPSASPTGSSTELRLGPDWQFNRRVFYAQANASGTVPGTLRMLYAPPSTPVAGNAATVGALWTDLWDGLKISYDVTSTTSVNAARDRSVKILAKQLQQRTDTINFLDGTSKIVTYTLGDTFHADPLVVSNPNSFSLYAQNYHSNGLPCGTGGSGKPTNPGYRCFADRHRQRRQMLFLAANDGQLHAFDIASFDSFKKIYLDDRKGLELFSYVPRLALPIVRDQAEGTAEIFSLDSPPRAADVFINPRYTTVPAATDDSNREWRTVIVGGFREGGSIAGGGQVNGFVSGYYALDVTQPDTLDSQGFPVNPGTPLAPSVPDCLDLNNQPVSANCGRNPFPAVLWEFTDSLQGSRFDEDGNSAPDLGATWSAPTIGRIKVTDSATNTVVDKWVAIFGGGFDPQNKTAPKSGTWIYIVDIETGQAIYKHVLAGAAAADPAVVDANQDGYLDTIYIGTTAGFLYKMDISTAASLHPVTKNKSLFLPSLAANATVLRVDDSAWDPFAIFSTGGRPIYYAPTAFFLPSIGRFILGFGSGDRENLWNLTGQTGRFYMIEDEAYTRLQSGLPKLESNYELIDSNVGDRTGSPDFILNPTPGKSSGWVLTLDPDERIITQAFGLSGVLIFSSYNPQVVVSGSGSTVLCARSGDSRQFIVYANNANAVLPGGTATARYLSIPEFVTNPFVEQGATKNSPATNKNSEQLDAIQQGIYNTLKKFAPKHARFANYWYSVSAVRSDTGYVREATIPISIVIKNWKEH